MYIYMVIYKVIYGHMVIYMVIYGHIWLYMVIYMVIYIYTYIYEIGKTRLYQTTNYTIFFTFYMLCFYVYLSFRSLKLLKHKYIAYKPYTFLHSVI